MESRNVRQTLARDWRIREYREWLGAFFANWRKLRIAYAKRLKLWFEAYRTQLEMNNYYGTVLDRGRSLNTIIEHYL